MSSYIATSEDLTRCTFCTNTPFRFILWVGSLDVTVRCEKCYAECYNYIAGIGTLDALDTHYNSGTTRVFETAEDLQLYVAKEAL